MNRATKLALAIGVPAAIVATGVQSVSASAPPTAPPVTDAGFVVPADFRFLTDDTGAITVGVPGSWTDVDTAPADGTPSIWAAPDLVALLTSIEAPGVMFEAEPFTADTASLANAHGYPDE